MPISFVLEAPRTQLIQTFDNVAEGHTIGTCEDYQGLMFRAIHLNPIKRRLEEQGRRMDSPKRLVRDFVDFEVDPRAGVGVWHQDRVEFVDRSACGTFLAKKDGRLD